MGLMGLSMTLLGDQHVSRCRCSPLPRIYAQLSASRKHGEELLDTSSGNDWSPDVSDVCQFVTAMNLDCSPVVCTLFYDVNTALI